MSIGWIASWWVICMWDQATHVQDRASARSRGAKDEEDEGVFLDEEEPGSREQVRWQEPCIISFCHPPNAIHTVEPRNMRHNGEEPKALHVSSMAQQKIERMDLSLPSQFAVILNLICLHPPSHFAANAPHRQHDWDSFLYRACLLFVSYRFQWGDVFVVFESQWVCCVCEFTLHQGRPGHHWRRITTSYSVAHKVISNDDYRVSWGRYLGGWCGWNLKPTSHEVRRGGAVSGLVSSNSMLLLTK
jgi:hypothetical protein